MRAKKQFGQHFLRDNSVVEAIVLAAAIEPGERVLEIGPGEGVVTVRLAEVSNSVVAVDIDKEAIETTSARVGEAVTLVNNDVLQIQDAQMAEWFEGSPYVLVGNLPYNITSELLRTFLTREYAPQRAVVMVQKEVAERMMAEPGDMSLLGLMCQLYAQVEWVIGVPRGAFAPPPKVESAVVKWWKYEKTDYHEFGYEDPEVILKFAKPAFAQRRKQIVSTLASMPGCSRESLQRALETIGHPATARPQELSVQDWVAFYRKVFVKAC